MTRQLLLLRHAKADSDASVPDIDRPLNDRGRASLTALAESFTREHLAPDVVLTSPARRAQETTDGLRAALPGARFAIEPTLYPGGVDAVLELLHALPDDVAVAAVVGHIPWLEDVVALLTQPVELSTAALAVVDLDTDSWSHFDVAPATLVAVHEHRG